MVAHGQVRHRRRARWRLHKGLCLRGTAHERPAESLIQGIHSGDLSPHAKTDSLNPAISKNAATISAILGGRKAFSNSKKNRNSNGSCILFLRPCVPIHSDKNPLAPGIAG